MILLCAVNTKYIHSNLAVRLLKAYAAPLPETVPAGTSTAEGENVSGPEIRIEEFTINNYAEDALARIYLLKPEAVFFSCYIWNWEFIRSLIPDLKKLLPDTDIWAGGPEVSFHSEEVLRMYPEIRGVIRGEGEAVFRDLAVGYYHRRTLQLRDIPGICLRESGRIRDNGVRELLPMDEIPFIYTDANIGEFDHKIIYYESQRGCPFSCAYCLSSVDRQVRFRSLELVFRELQFFLDHRVAQVKFVDRTFNVNRKHSEAILQYISDHDNGVTNFHFEIAGDLLSGEELAILSGMRPGCVQLEIGVQSANPDTLRAINRMADLTRLEQNVRHIKSRHNVHLHLDLIAGLPCEGFDSFADSFDRVIRMDPDQLQLGFLKLLKGSPMESLAEKYGIVCRQQPPYEVLRTDWISYEEIILLKKIEAILELYYNSRQFTKTLPVLEQAFSSPFRMYEALARFYDEHGLFISQPSRAYRYEVLLAFAREYDPGQEELYRELLVYDLYLRENLKSRPDFAPVVRIPKETLQQLHIGKTNHAELFRYPVHLGSSDAIRRKSTGPVLLVFDYSRRDPLDHNAYVFQPLSC